MSQIGSLQILRATAALMVAFGHLQHEALLLPAAAAGFSPVLIDLTGAGVDLFFVISGFVMVYASRELFAAPGGSGRFLRRRIARIVPLYWIMTSLFLATLVAAPHALSSGLPGAAEIAKSYVFIPFIQAGDGLMQPIYKLGWTLNYEMFFYVVFAGLLVLPMRGAVAAVAALFSGLVMCGAALRPAPGVLAYWTDPIILEFVMGALIAMLFMGGTRLSRPASAGLIGAAVAALAIATAAGLDAHAGLRPLLWGLPAAAIVAACVLGHGRLPEGRAVAVLIGLGDASYALYLLHPMVIRVLRLVFDRLGFSASLSPWLFVAVGFFGLLPVAWLTHVRIERPLTRRVQRWLTPRPAHPAPATA